MLLCIFAILYIHAQNSTAVSQIYLIFEKPSCYANPVINDIFLTITRNYIHTTSILLSDNYTEIPWQIAVDDLKRPIADLYVPRLHLVRGRRNGGVVLRSFALAMTLETPTLFPALGVFSVGTFVHRRITHQAIFAPPHHVARCYGENVRMPGESRYLRIIMSEESN